MYIPFTPKDFWGIAFMSRQRSTTFSKILISLMEEKNLTVRKAAALAGVGASTINSWRSGSSPEDYQAVKRLSKGLGVTLSFLLTGEDESRPDTALSVSEVLKEGDVLFDGFAKITVQRLIPRKEDLK